MFNVRTEIEAARYQRYFLRLMEAFERKFRPPWFSLLQKVFADAAKNIEHSDHDMREVIKRHRVEVNKRLLLDYRNTLSYFGTFTFDQFNKQYKKSVSAPNKKSMEDTYWSSVKEWSTISALKKSLLISDNTKDLIHGIVQRGMRDGLSNDDLVKQLLEGKKDFNKVRATMIVRTETHSAANKATESAVKSTGYPHDKVWRSTMDDRVRGMGLKDRYNHVLANGQKRPLEGFFDVSGDKLEFPGDPNGHAGNIVNCRCVLTYAIKEGAPPAPTPAPTPTPAPAPAPAPAPSKPPPLGGPVPNRRAPLEEWQKYRSVWEDGNDLRAVKKQFKEKFKCSQILADNSIAKTSAEKTKIINQIGNEFARMHRENPGLSTFVNRRVKLDNIILTDHEGLKKVLGSYPSEGVRGVYLEGRGMMRKKKIVLDWQDVNIKFPLDKPERARCTVGSWHSCDDRYSRLRHEYGHHLETTMSLNEFSGLYDKTLLRRTLSEYGSTNTTEMFSEAFSLHTHPNIKKYLEGIDGIAKARKWTKEEKSFFEKVSSYMRKKLDGPAPQALVVDKVLTGQVAGELTKRQQAAIDVVKKAAAEAEAEAIAKAAKELDIDPAYIEEMRNKFRDIIGTGDHKIYMNRKMRYPDSRSYQDVLQNGKFKNQFELKYGKATSGGCIDPKIGGVRDEWEKNIFQKSYQDSKVYESALKTNKRKFPAELAAERPKYGYLNDPSANHLHGRYGDVAFELKKEVVKRTTFTIGNSSSIYNNAIKDGSVFTSETPTKLAIEQIKLWKKMSAKDQNDLRNHIVEFIHGERKANGFSFYHGYIEAQIHGELSMADVASISIPKDSRAMEHIKDLAEKYKIPFVLRD